MNQQLFKRILVPFLILALIVSVSADFFHVHHEHCDSHDTIEGVKVCPVFIMLMNFGSENAEFSDYFIFVEYVFLNNPLVISLPESYPAGLTDSRAPPSLA